MADSKYGKYIITDQETLPPLPDQARVVMPPGWRRGLVSNSSRRIEGAFIQSASWIVKASPDRVWVKAHIHDFDETLNFCGSNPDDVKDLGGEIELWLEDEKFLLTKSCIVFLPKGMKHCPITIKRVDRPIFSFLVGTTGKMSRTMVDD
jgi:hypothetical protein